MHLIRGVIQEPLLSANQTKDLVHSVFVTFGGTLADSEKLTRSHVLAGPNTSFLPAS